MSTRDPSADAEMRSVPPASWRGASARRAPCARTSCGARPRRGRAATAMQPTRHRRRRASRTASNHERIAAACRRPAAVLVRCRAWRAVPPALVPAQRRLRRRAARTLRPGCGGGACGGAGILVRDARRRRRPGAAARPAAAQSRPWPGDGLRERSRWRVGSPTLRSPAASTPPCRPSSGCSSTCRSSTARIIADQERSIALYEAMPVVPPGFPPPLKEAIVFFARRHHEIVARFGRFPIATRRSAARRRRTRRRS
jgi:hypothetical protein